MSDGYACVRQVVCILCNDSVQREDKWPALLVINASRRFVVSCAVSRPVRGLQKSVDSNRFRYLDERLGMCATGN